MSEKDLERLKRKLTPITGNKLDAVSLKDSLACMRILGYGSVCYIKDKAVQERKYYLLKIDENSYLDVSAYIAGDELRQLTKEQVIAQTSDEEIHDWKD